MNNEESTLKVANHVLASILNDLSFLKDNNFLSHQTYNEVLAVLPKRISPQQTDHFQQRQKASTLEARPPLPIRKSTSTTTTKSVSSPQTSMPVPQLPTRRSTVAMSIPNNHNRDSMVTTAAAANSAHHHVGQPLAHTTAGTPVTAEPKEHQATSLPSPAPPAYTQSPVGVSDTNESLATAEALYNYQGEDPATDLSFNQGDVIEVIEYVNDDWWKGRLHGKTGIFPQNHVKKLPPPIKAKRPVIPTTNSSFSPPLYHQQNHQQQQPHEMNEKNTPTPFPSGSYYSQPPPSNAIYTPPPAYPPSQAYSQPPPPAAGPVVVNHVVGPSSTPAEGEEQQDKVANIAKKFGGRVATAATWGFGATLGSQAANAIF
ncbi:hypothetical protein BDF20DRAFT_349866 [Mycotypha africana]|uniref:uncharacterized protein n=1 Tax=Mycotypha africana TaxID=64632 RepID=UPI002300997F|nr:uncharacterized protein BDF20DRAFT_349866 [Mycotypha africana]KAI8966926.1 hypothetical protein BDF20DRAFT_349866 [Mycotypha africana]